MKKMKTIKVYIEGDGEVFTVLQASGNEFSVPWDVIHTITIGKKVQPLRHEGTKKKYEI